MAKKTKRKAPTRKAPAKRVKRANAKTAASTKRTARPVNGTLAIPGALKARLTEMAKSTKQTNWKRQAIELLTQASQP